MRCYSSSLRWQDSLKAKEKCKTCTSKQWKTKTQLQNTKLGYNKYNKINMITKHNETIYMKLMEHMSEAVCMTDKDWNSMYVNTKLCNLLWMEFDEIVGKPSANFLDPKSRRKVAHIDKQERKKWVRGGGRLDRLVILAVMLRRLMLPSRSW